QLPTHQVPRGKKEAGSWNPDLDEYGLGGGRLYVTCLSILCLEVYYRHLGIFRN
ncbi:MAG: squalene--hopene cyclase, partial [Thermoguttaceae bacterium]|nr:squalene--hopene cyclase [Thermoguttaceae bacterium]